MNDVAFEAVAREHAGVVARMAAAYAAKGPDRDDLAQEILLGLWRAWPRFRGEASQRTYVYRVAQNVAFDHLRRRYRNREDLVEAEARAYAPAPHVALDLAGAIRALRLPLREVAVLALEGLGPAEIGEVLGITEGNAAVRLTRARAELKQVLGEATP